MCGYVGFPLDGPCTSGASFAPMKTELLTTEQVADWAHCSRWTVARDVRAGHVNAVPGINGWLFTPAEARRYAAWKKAQRVS
jgi:hypothetical protein